MGETVKMASMELRFLHAPEETNGSLTMFEMHLYPGGRMPVPHYHRDWEETVYGLTGTNTWTVDGRTFAVGPGQSLHIPRGIVHGFTNDTAETTVCLAVLTPGVLTPAYFREMAALVDGGKPDPAKMKETMLRHGLVPAERGTAASSLFPRTAAVPE